MASILKLLMMLLCTHGCVSQKRRDLVHDAPSPPRASSFKEGRFTREVLEHDLMTIWNSGFLENNPALERELESLPLSIGLFTNCVATYTPVTRTVSVGMLRGNDDPVSVQTSILFESLRHLWRHYLPREQRKEFRREYSRFARLCNALDDRSPQLTWLKEHAGDASFSMPQDIGELLAGHNVPELMTHWEQYRALSFFMGKEAKTAGGYMNEGNTIIRIENTEGTENAFAYLGSRAYAQWMRRSGDASAEEQESRMSIIPVPLRKAFAGIIREDE